jgi:hypothetical protein
MNDLYQHCEKVLVSINSKYPHIQIEHWPESQLVDFGVVAKHDYMIYKAQTYVKDPPYRDESDKLYR